jgi:hypothetical protein
MRRATCEPTWGGPSAVSCEPGVAKSSVSVWVRDLCRDRLKRCLRSAYSSGSRVVSGAAVDADSNSRSSSSIGYAMAISRGAADASRRTSAHAAICIVASPEEPRPLARTRFELTSSSISDGRRASTAKSLIPSCSNSIMSAKSRRASQPLWLTPRPSHRSRPKSRSVRSSARIATVAGLLDERVGGGPPARTTWPAPLPIPGWHGTLPTSTRYSGRVLARTAASATRSCSTSTTSDPSARAFHSSRGGVAVSPRSMRRSPTARSAARAAVDERQPTGAATFACGS